MTTKLQLVVLEEPKIEKGVPIAPRYKSHNYPFSKMDIGDSVLLAPKDGEIQIKLRQRVSAAIYWASRSNIKKFCSRATEGGIRVWRIE